MKKTGMMVGESLVDQVCRYQELLGSTTDPDEINENWFASSIAISYISNGSRWISFADSLSKDGSIKIYNNVIAA